MQKTSVNLASSEELQSLLYSFVENRRGLDDVDGNLSELDNVFPRPHIPGYMVAQAEIAHHQSASWLPMSPTQFFPFAPLFPQPSIAISNVGRSLVQLAAEFSTTQPDKSIVKFEEICMIKEPKEQIISIPVMRSQSYIGRITKASWSTCDKTARSGTHFMGASGEIIFDKDDTKKEIQVKLLNSDETNDLRFTIKLSDDGVFEPTPMTIMLKKISNFDGDERNVVDNLPRSLPISVDDIKCALSDCLTHRTFHIGLTHLCSTRDTVDKQLALAFELSMMCLRNLRDDSVLNVLSDYFRLDTIDF